MAVETREGDRFMNIQEVENQTRLSRANIRFYEKEGLIAPERRSNGYRNYTQAEVDALLRIRLLRELGFSLQTVGQIQRGELDFQEVLERRIRETEQEERRLQSTRAVCAAMREAGADYATLNAQIYLNQFYRGLTDPPRRPSPLATDVVPPDPHPWRRWMARSLDGMLLSVLFVFVWCIPLHHFLQGVSNLGSTVMGVILMLALEPVLLHFFGATPGKWLMGISIRNEDGEKPSWPQAWLRTWGVLRWGHGFYIPIYNLYRGYRCYKAEMDGAVQEWDREAETTLCFRDVRLWRPWAVAGSYALLFGCMLLIGLASLLPPNRGDLTVEEFVENYQWYARQLNYSDTWQLQESGEFVRRDPSVIIVPEPEAPAPLQWTVEDGILTGISMDIRKRDSYDWENRVRVEEQSNYSPTVQQLAVMAIVGARAPVFSGLDILNDAQAWGGEVESSVADLMGVTLERKTDMVGYDVIMGNMLILEERAITGSMDMSVSITVGESQDFS